MHWVYETLGYFYYNNDINDYIKQMEYYIEIKYIKKYIDDFINNDKLPFNSGTETPHIVLNYLDYLLYKNNLKVKKEKYNNFVFKYRNSIEHFLPRHRKSGEEEKSEILNRLGNLCLIGTGDNVEISYARPYIKSKKINSDKSRYGIKLRIMANIVKDDESQESITWKKECLNHERDMIKVFYNELKEKNIKLNNEKLLIKYLENNN